MAEVFAHELMRKEFEATYGVLAKVEQDYAMDRWFIRVIDKRLDKPKSLGITIDGLVVAMAKEPSRVYEEAFHSLSMEIERGRKLEGRDTVTGSKIVKRDSPMVDFSVDLRGFPDPIQKISEYVDIPRTINPRKKLIKYGRY